MRLRPAFPLALLVVLGGGSTVAQLAFAAPAAEAPALPATVARPAAAPAIPASVALPPSPRPHLHRIAVLRGEVGLSERPGGPAAVRVASTTEFGSPHALSVAARRGDWLGVVTTELPNGKLGWVRRGSRSLRLRRTRWSLHADISARTLTLRRNGRRVYRLRVAVGAPGSDTPTGRFSVTDKLSGSSFGPYYGCCVLALSGHQPNTPPGWRGGNRLAIHGTNAPGTIGTAASAGCLRAADADLQVLMRKVPLGTSVFVHA